jgi:fatty-acyl-CoA synthase
MYNVPDWLERRAALSPNKVALIDATQEFKEITYREWNQQVNRTARFLRDRFHLKKGDRVAVLAKNCVEYLDIWFALAKIGGILQNLNWRLTPGELKEMIEEAAPRVLFYDKNEKEFGGTIRELRDSLEVETQMASFGERFEPDDSQISMRDAYPESSPTSPELSPEDPWVICYTGGTTGLPKGAVLSHRAITANAINTIISWGLSPDDVTILNSPLFHTGGLNVFTAPLIYLGGTSIVCREFDLLQTYDLLEHGGVTVWFGVPTMFVMMQNHPRLEKADFSRLKILISGGAPCPMPVFERFWEKGVDFKTGYGLTEAGPNTFWLPPEMVKEKPGAVGYPLFHVDVSIVDEEGNHLGTGETGELVIRGPHMFSGYWNNPVASADAVRDGWLHTGDLASRDEDGVFSIVGRLKDMIISGGENIYPSEIESVLHAHPVVAEAALIGMPDEKWGEVGWAIVVLRSDVKISAEELIEFCRERLARYKIPKRIIFAEMLPKTGANKIDKNKLQEMYTTGSV